MYHHLSACWVRVRNPSFEKLISSKIAYLYALDPPHGDRNGANDGRQMERYRDISLYRLHFREEPKSLSDFSRTVGSTFDF